MVIEVHNSVEAFLDDIQGALNDGNLSNIATLQLTAVYDYMYTTRV